ncbi:MAG: S41 family peptidase [bacterium]
MEKFVPRHKKRPNFTILVVLVAVFIGGLFIGRATTTIENGNIKQIFSGRLTDKAEQVNFDTFWDVWKLIEDRYVDQPLDYSAMLDGAINGMVYALDDPYTLYMNPDEAKEFQNEIDGKFSGIGAEIGIKNEQLTIIAPLENSPAKKAGLLSGDLIKKINGEDVTSLSLYEAVAKIRGEKGSEVVLTIARKDSFDEKDFTIMRDQIDIKSVTWEMNNNGVVYMELTQFAEKTTGELDLAISQILPQNPKGIILDLRDNSGGLLQVSVEVASEFLEENDIVAIEEYADNTETISRSNGSMRLGDLPMVVLINEGSASAAEILAGALADNRDVSLIGKTTFGKGTVQELHTLDNDGALRVSVAKWLTPNRIDINKAGIDPTIEVELSDEDFNSNKDPQLEKAYAEINKQL